MSVAEHGASAAAESSEGPLPRRGIRCRGLANRLAGTACQVEHRVSAAACPLATPMHRKRRGQVRNAAPAASEKPDGQVWAQSGHRHRHQGWCGVSLRGHRQITNCLAGGLSRVFTTLFVEAGARWPCLTPGVFDFSNLCSRIATPDRTHGGLREALPRDAEQPRSVFFREVTRDPVDQSMTGF